MEQNEKRVIYLAGGCFWGMEKLMQSIPGVLDAESGYANGSGEQDADYKTVCTGKTGFRETVKVTYDPARVSLDQLLFAYFEVVDPTAVNRQGHDIGTQYQAGVYYADAESQATVERVAAIERARTPRFSVEIGPLVNFFPAEEYHQNYLDKNPNGYCHIPFAEIARLSKTTIDAGRYRKPEEAKIRESLTPEQFDVTQKSATERPFVYQRVLRQHPARAVCGRRDRRTSLHLGRHVPFLLRLAFVHQAGRAFGRRGARGQQPLHAPRGGALPRGRFASGPRV